VRTAVVLFTRDLRVHDQPALAQAAREAERVVPLFVLDDAIRNSDFVSRNRLGFLLEALSDLDRSLRQRGASLVVRRGEVVEEVARFGGDAVWMGADVSAYAQARERGLRDRVPLRVVPSITVVAPDALQPTGRDHYEVFSPYHRAWSRSEFRALEEPPGRLKLPEGLDPGRLPALAELAPGERAPEPMAPGGETQGRRRMQAWIEGGMADYGARHQLDEASTSRLSPYLHFGCISPLELVRRAEGRKGGPAYIRQVAWRDFYHGLLRANPHTRRDELRPRGDRFEGEGEALERWKEGATGYPIVDAGMRQLLREGWMHNRARLINASFLVKHLYVDWRLGAQHFFDHLLDGDVASNIGNWQWVAGTGVDTRPYRVYNPALQAERHDPGGDYVRRWVPELAELGAGEIHDPPAAARRRLGYPERIVEHREAVARFRAHRAAGSEQLELDVD